MNLIKQELNECPFESKALAFQGVSWKESVRLLTSRPRLTWADLGSTGKKYPVPRENAEGGRGGELNRVIQRHFLRDSAPAGDPHKKQFYPIIHRESTSSNQQAGVSRVPVKLYRF